MGGDAVRIGSSARIAGSREAPMFRQNVIANFVGRGWGFISVYLFVPLYLKFLGIEAYGLVGFYATLLGFLTFADMGLTATLNREIARLSARSNAADAM